MTDPTHTTSEQIALKLGWTYEKGRYWRAVRMPEDYTQTLQEWKAPNGSYHENVPDYEHDWAHNGPLQDELWAAGFDLSHDAKDGTFYWYKINEYGTPLDDDREDTTDLKVATALDWLAWRKEEK